VKEQLEKLVLQMYKSGIQYAEAVREFQKTFIVTVLQEQKGNQVRAARELRMHRNTLSRTIRDLEVDMQPFCVHRVADRLSARAQSQGKGRPGRVSNWPDSNCSASPELALGMKVEGYVACAAPCALLEASDGA
jgi:Fis family transcriptional regulator, factor for inversion stimulation protein